MRILGILNCLILRITEAAKLHTHFPIVTAYWAFKQG
jgi:hypothetical protein